MPTLKAILFTLAFGLALVVAAPDTAQAAPQRDVSYSWANVQLTDSDGTTGNYHVLGSVRYGTKNNPPRGTYCSYLKLDESGNWTGDGTYYQSEPIADASNAGVRQFCFDNFVNRT
jgi:hypothetical protein